MRGELEGFSLILVLPDYQRAEFPFLPSRSIQIDQLLHSPLALRDRGVQ